MRLWIFSSMLSGITTGLLVLVGLFCVLKYLWPKYKLAVITKDTSKIAIIMIISAILFAPMVIIEGLFLLFEWDKGKAQ